MNGGSRVGFADRFGAPAILARWSRLLVDLNRGADDPTVVMKLSDGRIIPGNRVLEIRFSKPLERLLTVHVELVEGILGTDKQPLIPWKLDFMTAGS